ncbi:unnamed protein product [Dovyalis caffra]|uniref:Uncharacterized protein n=1 Tax=Dovyalis caffra TaxID=77055 RepID=A0AAV1RI75_9ROSI|nr:unnamed protein product [Dovyalis caffra]
MAREARDRVMGLGIVSCLLLWHTRQGLAMVVLAYGTRHKCVREPSTRHGRPIALYLGIVRGYKQGRHARGFVARLGIGRLGYGRKAIIGKGEGAYEMESFLLIAISWVLKDDE